MPCNIRQKNDRKAPRIHAHPPMTHIHLTHQKFNFQNKKRGRCGSLHGHPRFKLKQDQPYLFMAMVSPSMESTVVTIFELA